MKRGNVKLVGMALILMLLGSFFIVISPRPHYYVPPEQSLHTHYVSFNVSLDESERFYPIEALAYGSLVTRIGITDMETNGTSVGLSIQNRNNVTVFAISSVSLISNSSLVVQASANSRVIVTRETGNANGSFVILIWYIVFPPIFDPVVPVLLYINIFILLGFTAYVFWKVVTMKTARKSIRPAWVAVLVLVGLVLVTPFISGFLGGFFTPTEMTEQVYSDTRTLVLNGPNPNSHLLFGNEISNNTESFRIHSFEDDDKRYHFELLGVAGEVVLSATHENSSISWEIIGGPVIQDHSLSLDRVDSDVEASLTIEASATIVRVPVDPLPDSILAIIGFIALILAVVTSLAVQTVEKVGQNW
ncbi:MAG: hypothetical protein ACFFER_11570 [Candidatus Thorarchaeota archaeon]